jgi:hypothetical protein
MAMLSDRFTHHDAEADNKGTQQSIACCSADTELSIPVWVKYLRRTMMEEAHSSPAVIHIFQTIVRHADLLYCARAHFATHVRRRPKPKARTCRMRYL